MARLMFEMSGVCCAVRTLSRFHRKVVSKRLEAILGEIVRVAPPSSMGGESRYRMAFMHQLGR